VLKPQEFMDRLAFAGEGVLVFAQALLLKPEVISLGDGTRIDDFTRIEGGLGVEIGRHVHISSFCSIFAGGGAKLGDYSCMAQGSRILTGSERLDAAMSSVAPTEWRQVDTGISIVDHLAFLGANSVLMPGVTLAVGAVLGAGGVATRSIPPWEVWGGVPARRISLRDPEPLRARGVPVDELMERPLLGL
jgi:galactoside O-acetyltransferase